MTVTLVLGNGQEFTIQTSTLSAADQEFLKSMAATATATPTPGSPTSPTPSGPAPVDSDVSLETINEMFGHPLFEDGDLWQNQASEVAERLSWPRESETPFSSSYRAYPKEGARILGARPYSAALYGDDGKVTSLSIVFANKGDFFGSRGSGEEEIRN